MPMDAQAIINAVRDFFDEDGWNYDFEDNPERPVIHTGARIHGKLKDIKEIVLFRDTYFIALGICPINADTDNIAEMAKYLSMANYGLIVGNFELDVSDGEIRYKTFVDCDGLESLSKDIVRRAITIPYHMFDRYGDGIAALCMGFSDAETEYEKVMKQDE